MTNTMKKYNVEFYDKITGCYDDPINDEPITAENAEDAIRQAYWIAEELIERMNPETFSEKIDQFRSDYPTARAIEIE